MVSAPSGATADDVDVDDDDAAATTLLGDEGDDKDWLCSSASMSGMSPNESRAVVWPTGSETASFQRQ